MFKLKTLLIMSLLFLHSNMVCFISFDKNSAKSNDCCNSFDALLRLWLLHFNKLCTDFWGVVLRVAVSCFLITAFFFSFSRIPVSSIL